MIKYLEKTGRTMEEAIAAALAELGKSEEEISVEVLERAKSGFLGIGAQPALIRVSYEVPDEPAEEKKEAPAPKKTEKKPEAKKAEEKKPEPKKAEKKPAPAPVDETGEFAAVRTFISGLMERMGVEAEIEISRRDNGGINVKLSGSGMGAIIGRRGETLDAIQHLRPPRRDAGRDPAPDQLRRQPRQRQAHAHFRRRRELPRQARGVADQAGREDGREGDQVQAQHGA